MSGYQSPNRYNGGNNRRNHNNHNGDNSKINHHHSKSTTYNNNEINPTIDNWRGSNVITVDENNMASSNFNAYNHNKAPSGSGSNSPRKWLHNNNYQNPNSNSNNNANSNANTNNPILNRNSSSGANTPNRSAKPAFNRQKSNPTYVTNTNPNSNPNKAHSGTESPAKGPRSWRNQEANIKSDQNESSNNSMQTPRYRPPQNRTKPRTGNTTPGNSNKEQQNNAAIELNKRWNDLFQRFQAVQTTFTQSIHEKSNNKSDLLKQFHKLLSELKTSFQYPIAVTVLKSESFNSSIIILCESINTIINNDKLFVNENDNSLINQYYSTLSLFFHLISTFVLKKQFVIDTLASEQAYIIMHTIIDCIKHNNNVNDKVSEHPGYNWLRIDSLRVLSYVLFENITKFKQFRDELLSLLLPLLDIHTKIGHIDANDKNGNSNLWIFDIEYRRMAINCVGNLCLKSGKLLQTQFPTVFNALLLLFSKRLLQAKQNSKYNSILASILRAINSILPDLFTCFPTNSKLKAHSINVSTLLTELRKVLQWGLPFSHNGLSTGIAAINHNLQSIGEGMDEITDSSTNTPVNSAEKRRLSVQAGTRVNVAAAAFSPNNLTLFTNPNNNETKSNTNAIGANISNANNNSNNTSSGPNDSSLFSGLFARKSVSAVDNSDSEDETNVHNYSYSTATEGENDSDYPLIGRSNKQSQAKKAKEFENLTGEKVRNYAVQCIQTICRCAGKLESSDYSNFIPVDTRSATSAKPFNGAHLLTIILYDPSAKVRSISATALSMLLTQFSATELHSRLSLKSSQTNNKRDQLIALHQGLYQALTQEQQFSVLAQILKCISVLVSITPYQVLQTPIVNSPGLSAIRRNSLTQPQNQKPQQLLVPIVLYLVTQLLHDPTSYADDTNLPQSKSAKPYNPANAVNNAIGVQALISHSSVKFDLRHAIFSCLSSIFDTTSAVEELTTYLSSSISQSVQLIPILIQHARTRKSTDPTPDAYTVLSRIARHYKLSMATYWNWDNRLNKSSLSELILFALYNPSDYSSKLLALKIIEEWTKIDISILNENSDGNDLEDSNANNSVENNLFFNMAGIKDFYAKDLIQLYKSHSNINPATIGNDNRLQSLIATIRSKIVTVLSYIPFSWYIQFNLTQQNELQSLSLAAAADSIASIRAASCRCLGLFALYNSRLDLDANNNRQFCIQAIRSLISLLSNTEKVLAVRSKSVWALANLCDYGHSTDAANDNSGSSSSIRPYLHELIPAELFLALIKNLLSSTQDNDKIAANSVRALGNIVRWLPFNLDNKEINYESLWIDIVTVLNNKLIDVKTSVKTRWNCCYAVGNMLKNLYLPFIIGSSADNPCMNILGQSFNALLEILQEKATKSSANATNNTNNSISPTNDRKLLTKTDIKSANNNFKVRINAVVALSSPLTYQHYGNYYYLILSTLLEYYAAVDTLPANNLREKNYLTTLKLQLISSLLVILTKLNPTIKNSELIQLLISNIQILAKLIFDERIKVEKFNRTQKFRSIQQQAQTANNNNNTTNYESKHIDSTLLAAPLLSPISPNSQRNRASFSFLSTSNSATSSTAAAPNSMVLDVASNALLAIYQQHSNETNNYAQLFHQIANEGTL